MGQAVLSAACTTIHNTAPRHSHILINAMLHNDATAVTFSKTGGAMMAIAVLYKGTSAPYQTSIQCKVKWDKTKKRWLCGLQLRKAAE